MSDPLMLLLSTTTHLFDGLTHDLERPPGDRVSGFSGTQQHVSVGLIEHRAVAAGELN